MVDPVATLLALSKKKDLTNDGNGKTVLYESLYPSRAFSIICSIAVLGLPMAVLAVQFGPLFTSNERNFRDVWVAATLGTLLLSFFIITVINYTLVFGEPPEIPTVSASVGGVGVKAGQVDEERGIPVKYCGGWRTVVYVIHFLVLNAYIFIPLILLVTQGYSATEPSPQVLLICTFVSGGLLMLMLIINHFIDHVELSKKRSTIGSLLKEYGIAIPKDVDWEAYRAATLKEAEKTGVGSHITLAITGKNVVHSINSDLTPVLKFAEETIKIAPDAHEKALEENKYCIRGLIENGGEVQRYIVAPTTAKIIDQLANIGTLAEDHKPYTKQTRISADLHEVYGENLKLELVYFKDGVGSFGYKFFFDNVAGAFVGFGHWLYLPIRWIQGFVLFLLPLYALLLHDAVNAALIWTGCALLPFVLALFGHSGHFFHLFIVCNIVFISAMYIIPAVGFGNVNSYILYSNIWNTALPYYPNDSYTTIDNSTTVYAFSLGSLSYSISLFIACIIQLVFRCTEPGSKKLNMQQPYHLASTEENKEKLHVSGSMKMEGGGVVGSTRRRR
jgi:hypothetical protein